MWLLRDGTTKVYKTAQFYYNYYSEQNWKTQILRWCRTTKPETHAVSAAELANIPLSLQSPNRYLNVKVGHVFISSSFLHNSLIKKILGYVIWEKIVFKSLIECYVTLDTELDEDVQCTIKQHKERKGKILPFYNKNAVTRPPALLL